MSLVWLAPRPPFSLSDDPPQAGYEAAVMGRFAEALGCFANTSALPFHNYTTKRLYRPPPLRLRLLPEGGRSGAGESFGGGGDAGVAAGARGGLAEPLGKGENEDGADDDGDGDGDGASDGDGDGDGDDDMAADQSAFLVA